MDVSHLNFISLFEETIDKFTAKVERVFKVR